MVLVEGAGGWRVPINQRETLADLAQAIGAPVVLVVGLRLGCLNHALLTAEAIRADGLELAGWVANAIDPDMPCREGNIDTLRHWLHMEQRRAPCPGYRGLGFLPAAQERSPLDELTVEPFPPPRPGPVLPARPSPRSLAKPDAGPQEGTSF